MITAVILTMILSTRIPESALDGIADPGLQQVADLCNDTLFHNQFITVIYYVCEVFDNSPGRINARGLKTTP